MKLIKTQNFLLILFVLILFTNCEKDDICVDGNPSLLVIRFYDINNQIKFKPVTKLRVKGLGNDFPLSTFADRSSAIDSIGIPLKVDEDKTAFLFVINSADADNKEKNEIGNTDTLTFTYKRTEKFVSRACGFIISYNNLTYALADDSEQWIKEVEIINTTINNQGVAHVKIFH